MIEIKAVSCGVIEENAYIVSLEGRDDCVVVDPGDQYPKLKYAVGEKRVGAILLTHGHFDHILAVGEMARETGAPTYIAEGDMEMLNDPELNGYQSLMGRVQMEGPLLRAQPYGASLQVCGLDIRVLPTPGHSRGSVCLYLPGEAALFSGDTLFRAGYGRMDLHGGSVSDMRDSLMKLFQLPPQTRVYPGHGDPTTIGEERARYRL